MEIKIAWMTSDAGASGAYLVNHLSVNPNHKGLPCLPLIPLIPKFL